MIDIVAVLTNQANYDLAKNYWKVLKHRLSQEGSEVVTNCNQLKMIALDGKLRLTDVADLQSIFRLIQSIPSPKAEPIKMWLASVGNERINEIGDPELSPYTPKLFTRKYLNEFSCLERLPKLA